jgi:hypothetical protein
VAQLVGYQSADKQGSTDHIEGELVVGLPRGATGLLKIAPAAVVKARQQLQRTYTTQAKPCLAGVFHNIWYMHNAN